MLAGLALSAPASAAGTVREAPFPPVPSQAEYNRAARELANPLNQPVTGALGDRYGAGRVAAAGGLLYAAGLGLVALHPSAITALLGIGVMTGLGVGCAGTGSVIAAVGRAAPPERRGSLLGIANLEAIDASYQRIGAFLVLVLILIFKPTGLLGKSNVEKV